MNASSPWISHVVSPLLIYSHYQTTVYHYFLVFSLRTFLCIRFSFHVFVLVLICFSPFILERVNVLYSINPTSQPVAYISRRRSNALYDYVAWEFGCFWDLLRSKTASSFPPLHSYTDLLKRRANACKSTQMWKKNLLNDKIIFSEGDNIVGILLHV